MTMKMRLTLTPETNVDDSSGNLINDKAIIKAAYDWNGEVLVQDKSDEQCKTVKVSDVSIYDHLLLLDDGEYYKILHAFSM